MLRVTSASAALALWAFVVVSTNCSSSSSVERTCDPGSNRACTCDGGETGISACLAGGGYGACTCSPGTGGSGGSTGGSGGSGGSTGGSGGSTGGSGGEAGADAQSDVGTGGSAGAAGGAAGSGGSAGADGGTAVEIQQIQDGTVSIGTAVRVENVFVTAGRQQTSGALNFVMQEPQGDTSGGHAYPAYAGCSAFVSPAVAAAGIILPSIADCVTVTGTVEEFQGNTQIVVVELSAGVNCGSFPSAFSLPGATATFVDVATDTDPSAAGLQAGQFAERFEGVLIRINAVQAPAAPVPTGEFNVVEQSNTTGATLSVGDFYYAFPAVAGQNFASITGIFGQFVGYQLLPRSLGDIVVE